MQDYQELTPDAEVFRRVWQRVMPDDTYSPIAVHQPGEERRPGPAPGGEPPRRPEKPQNAEQELRVLLRMMDEALGTVAAIVRRQPGAWPLRDSIRRSAAQLRSAWFLHTGRRWAGNTGPSGRDAPLEQLLRRQYMWEIRFTQQCRQTGVQEIREILPQLEEDSNRRRGMIRRMLVRM